MRKIGSEVASESFQLSSEIDCNCYKTVDQENGLECGWCDVGKDVSWGYVLRLLRNKGRDFLNLDG